MSRKLTMGDLKAQAYARDLKNLLGSSPTFRRFILTLLNDAGIYMPTYRQGSPAAASDHVYQEGRRSLGLEVLHELKGVRPDLLAILEAEGELIVADVNASQAQEAQADSVAPSLEDDE